LRDLRWKKPLQAPDALDFGNLFGHPLLEGPVPIREIGCLRQHAILERLQAQDRSYSGQKRGLVHRLCQIFVGAGVESRHDVLGINHRGNQNDGHERKRSVAFQATANLESVEFRHHHIEQDEVRQKCFGGGDRLLAIRSFAQRITLGREPRREDVTVGFVVVDDQNARRIVHDLAPDGSSRRVFANFSEQRPRAEGLCHIGSQPAARASVSSPLNA
jgi:hypothetical protein